jgi:peptidoglycan/xylan/chitin deacetylase (PgdA/CDA1 family)
MQTQPLILMYHRVAEIDLDPWELAVTQSNFEEHLSVLKKTRTVLSLDEFVTRHRRRNLPANAVALTFDDGHLDNLTAAKPLLEAAGVPATVYIATGYANQNTSFWWDELAELVLKRIERESIEFFFEGRFVRFELGPLHSSAITRHSRAPAGSPVDRRSALQIIWMRLRALRRRQRDTAMRALRGFATLGEQADSSRPLTSDEVCELADGGLVSIGAHTVTHPSLKSLEPRDCQAEIVESRDACEEMLGRPITGFAYPFGDGDFDVRAMVVAAGFSHACSIIVSPVLRSSDPFVLPRIKIVNGNGGALETALRVAQSATASVPG